MKTIALFIFVCLSFAAFHVPNSASTTSTCFNPGACSNDLTDSFFFLNQIDTLTESYAKIPMPSNYHDVRYAKGTGDCTTGATQTTCSDDPSALVYKVFYPDSSVVDYHTCRLPAVFIIHGGGFKDCGGSYLDSGIVRICQEFAKRGFIAFSVEYRLGALVPSSTQYSAQQILAIYRASQDIRGFIRTVIKRQRSTEPTREPYQFDSTRLFIGGASAGSVVAMSAIFYTQGMFNQLYPGINNSNILGNVDKNFYYGEATINYSIKGFLDMWGGLSIPPSYLDSPEAFFKQDTMIIPPTIIFHGKRDPTFNYKYQKVDFWDSLSSSGIYNKDSNCLQSDGIYYQLNSDGNADGYLLGGQNIYEMLGRMHIGSELYIDCQMKHGLDTTTNPSLYKSDFGTGSTNTTTTGIYIVQRAATYFQAILNHITDSLTTTKFVECENYRVRCMKPDSNNGCSNTDSAENCPNPRK